VKVLRKTIRIKSLMRAKVFMVLLSYKLQVSCRERAALEARVNLEGDREQSYSSSIVLQYF
jgi:hypothetical protein